MPRVISAVKVAQHHNPRFMLHICDFVCWADSEFSLVHNVVAPALEVDRRHEGARLRSFTSIVVGSRLGS